MTDPIRRALLRHVAGVLLAGLGCYTARAEPRAPNPLALWYRQPAAHWNEAMPVGNGRLGAMVFGGIEHERLALNEDTFYAGQPFDYVNPAARRYLPEARKLIFAGEYAAADKLISEKMLARSRRECAYQPIGDLMLDFPGGPGVSGYERDLNLDTAITSVHYVRDGVAFTREVFASPVDQVIVVRITADRPGAVTFSAALRTPQTAVVRAEGEDTLVMSGNGSSYGRAKIPGALRWECRVRALAVGGQVSVADHVLTVERADSAVLLVDAATAFKSFSDISGDPAAITTGHIQQAATEGIERLRERHIAEHQRVFRRVALDLGTSEASAKPTDERLQAFARGGSDPGLVVLFYQFGRYLLISSSRPGSQPANLQGIWNESITPPWESKNTTNINTEMNYWLAEPANLSEFTAPLFSALRDLSVTGAQTARMMFNARGWVAFHNFDLWRGTAPVDGIAGYTPTCGAWLTNQLWEHYLFTGDKKFLADVYPILRGAAQFFCDFLVEEPSHHWLVTCPTVSPENSHPPGRTFSCAGSTMDEAIVRDLFAHTARAAEILGIDAEFREELRQKRARLAPYAIGRAGQLQEWLEDWDLEVKDPHHRHLSHLYGLYPSDQITVDGTPKLALAARKSLELRTDEGPGWSKAWKICLWARLHDGDHAFRVLRSELRPTEGHNVAMNGGGTYPNLFNALPPFQIDGNFGATAGITEMLLQSHVPAAAPLSADDESFIIELLPALPSAWRTGSVRGLRARGGFEIDISWDHGDLVRSCIHSEKGGKAWIRYQGRLIEATVPPGGSVTLPAAAFRDPAPAGRAPGFPPRPIAPEGPVPPPAS